MHGPALSPSECCNGIYARYALLAYCICGGRAATAVAVGAQRARVSRPLRQHDRPRIDRPAQPDIMRAILVSRAP